jgi:hypothetical protein
MRRVVSVAPKRGRRLHLQFDDGTEGDLDFAQLVEQGGVFRKLADSAYFSRVRVGKDGTFITWPGQLDFCAQALWLEVTGAATQRKEKKTA